LGGLGNGSRELDVRIDTRVLDAIEFNKGKLENSDFSFR